MILGCETWAVRRHRVDYANVPGYQERLLAGVPTDWIDAHVLSPAQSKHEREFWMYRDPRGPLAGIGSKVLQTPELFRELFPGYPLDFAQQSGFWRRYFSRQFDIGVRLPALNPTGTEFRAVKLPSTGCLDVFERQGADVVVMGTSTTYDALIPSELNQSLAPAYGDPKVVFCTRPGLGSGILDLNFRAARILSHLNHRAKAVLWGFDMFSAYQANTGPATPDNNLSLAMNQWQRSTLSLPLDFRVGALFGDLSWTELLPYNRRKLEFAEVVRDMKLTSPAIESDMRRQIQDHGYAFRKDPRWIVIPESRADDNALIARAAKDLAVEIGRPEFQGGPQWGVTEKDCDLGAASKELDRLLNELLKFADNVFIFVSPVAPGYAEGLPPCYEPGFFKMLRSRESARVHIKTDSWAEYGLAWSDTLFPVSQDELFDLRRLDYFHVNFRGAQKVSRKLGRWMVAETRRE